MTTYRMDRYEGALKTSALGLGILSTIAIVQDLYPWNMVLSLPFCLIWAYHGWRHTEPQLKWINIFFTGLYVYGLGRFAYLAWVVT